MECLSRKEQLEMLDRYFLSTTEAINMLQISRQNFYSLISRNKITRIKKDGAVLFFKDEILDRLSNQPMLRTKYRPFESREELESKLQITK
ncbi:helix-turn-helix domain-containing protein [Listeria booriae]|uniref:Helix-turn-helix domain-containing protein n=1 Tax=Listeria booriae TaxID=1552123 RepID=A0A7X1CJF8_9LIST|nr:helix-turn-helix domain-containing protein [Listeria booriae]MBC1551408.1 helix-turn-helix domain-containing protein [Listeria booriae]MBC1565955.1 helix-turn-helix domain-containing protein [Listeria booriae]MBC1780056.1 helix-turn-helix domain-containing protein [Listeria booriae]MBC1887744.1 helix-turn-helix domain-containing protein [Listeria booriae]MBC2164820.1 helix-turn-helix domain-containing protein [Listeria booriae]